MKRPFSEWRILVTVLLAAAGCGEARTPAGGPPVPQDSNEAGAGGSAGGPVDAGLEDAVMPSPGFDGPLENCRWEGYGIGPLGQGQCFSSHLLVHSYRECGAEHGQSYEQPRAIQDQCVGDSDEAQVLCCFADGVPPAELTDPINSIGTTLSQGDPPSSRSDMLARANDICAQSSKRLGDWSLRYAVDGVTPDVLRFGCR